MRNEFCNKNISGLLDLKKHKNKNPNKKERTIFTKQEIKILWENKEDPYVKAIIILIYTGLRIATLLDLKKENVHIDERYFFIEKDKNQQSIRNVPLIKEWYERDGGCEYLLSTQDNLHLTYNSYLRKYWSDTLSRLGISNHSPHDARHTFSTLMSEANVDLFHIKLIMGHKAGNITQDTYTHLDIQTLICDVDKIHPTVMA